MSPRTTHDLSMPGFIADHKSMDLYGSGAQIDWSGVAAVNGVKSLPAGTVMSRLASGLLVPRTAQDIVANPTRTAVGLLATNAAEIANTQGHHAKSGYGLYVGGVVYETLLPEVADAEWADIKDELVASGTGWVFQPYADDRAS